MHFSLSFLQRLYKLGGLLVILLVLLDLLAFFYYPETLLHMFFLATAEQTPLTWISAVALLFIALACFSLYHTLHKKIWYFLAALFFFFSIDDAVYIHERLSGYVVTHSDFFGSFPTYIWSLLYAPLVMFALGALLYLLWQKTSFGQKRYIIMATLLLAGAVFLDLLDGFVEKNDQLVFCAEALCNVWITHLMRLIEEVIEVLAFGILGYYTFLQNNIYEKRVD